MLRTVCLENFVKFKEYQRIDFNEEGPTIFIGENVSGKSSVGEGIRRCLKPELSSSLSTWPDLKQISYYICKFEKSGAEQKNIICGIVAVPENLKQEDTIQKECYKEEECELGLRVLFSENGINDGEGNEAEFRSTNQDECNTNEPVRRSDASVFPVTGNKKEIGNESAADDTYSAACEGERRYRFAMQYDKASGNKIFQVHVNLVKTSDGRKGMEQPEWCLIDVDTETQKRLLDAMETAARPAPARRSIRSFLTTVFNKKFRAMNAMKACPGFLDTLSKEVVFTFPLRGIGALQWSNSDRNRVSEREKNYSKAEERCEVLQYYLTSLTDCNEHRFDREKERDIFESVTQRKDYHFELKDGKITIEDNKYALLKTPEGILEAKIFSILMSSKVYKTLFLDEPDRGMHPQFIERMMQVIKEAQSDKRVILTTHNPALITPWSASECYVFRPLNDEHRIISVREIVGAHIKGNIHIKKLRLLTSDHLEDILFAKRVLFFEGVSEMLFLTELKHQILQGELQDIEIFRDDETGYSLLKRKLLELTFVRMNGKGLAGFCHEICTKLKLEHIILVDKDANEETPWTQPTDKCMSTGPSESEWLKERKFFWVDGDIEDMVIQMFDRNDALLQPLNKRKLNLRAEIFGRKEKNKGDKLFLREDVTPNDVRECVNIIANRCTKDHDLYEFIKLLRDGDAYEPNHKRATREKKSSSFTSLCFAGIILLGIALAWYFSIR